MASLVLYGSDVADATLTTACDMTINTGGTETSKTTTWTGASVYGEFTSQGGSIATVSALPAPTGNGWVYSPGAGTFATGNWSGSIALADTTTGPYTLANGSTLRFYRYSSGTYTSIGSISNATQPIAATRTVVTYAATSMSTVTFGASDLLYVDLWGHDAGGLGGLTPQVYETTSATAGLASDVQITTSSFTAGGITNNNMASTDALVVSDLGPALFSWHVDALTATDSPLFTDGDIPVEALSAGDTLLATDTDLPIDALSASDLGGNLQRWPVDALSAADSALWTDTDIPVEALSASDTFLQTDTDLATDALTVSDLGGNLQRWPVDALVASDSLLGVDVALPVEGLTGVEVDLNTDVYRSIEALSVADSSTMVQTPLLTTTTYPFTDALVVADSFLAVDGTVMLEGNLASDSMVSGQGGLFAESLATSDALLESDGYATLDALIVSDLGTLARWPVESLSASDSFAASDSYVPTEVTSVLDGLLATDGAGWVDLLSVSDTSTMVSAAAATLLFLSATWITRDGQATWKTRDGLVTWKARDDQAGWNTRDETDTWKTRDEQDSWKTRQ